MLPLLAVTALFLLPNLWTAVLSLKDYSPVYGMANSAWVGLRNLTEFIQTPAALPLILNTLRLWAIGLVGAMVFGLLAALLVSLARSRGLSAVWAGLLLIPAFLPPVVWTTLSYRLAGLLGDDVKMTLFTQRYDLLYLLVSVPSRAALVGFAGAAWATAYHARSRKPSSGALKGALAGACVCAMLPVDVETIRMTYNPLSYKYADTLYTYTFRKGFLEGQYSQAAAAGILALALQTILAAVFCAALILLIRHSTFAAGAASAAGGANAAPTAKRDEKTAGWPWIVAGVFALALLFANGLPDLGALQTDNLGYRLVAYLLAAVVTTTVGLIVILTARASRICSSVCIALLCASSGVYIGLYMLLRMLGLINTALAPAFSGVTMPGTLIFLVVIAVVMSFGTDSRAAVPAIGAAAAFALARAIGAVDPTLVYMTQSSMASAGQRLYQTALAGPSEPGAAAAAYAAVLLPVLIFSFIGAFFAGKAVKQL